MEGIDYTSGSSADANAMAGVSALSGEVGSAYTRLSDQVSRLLEVADTLIGKLEVAGLLSGKPVDANAKQIREVVSAPFADRVHGTADAVEAVADNLLRTTERLEV